MAIAITVAFGASGMQGARAASPRGSAPTKPRTEIEYSSQPGDFIGQGHSATLTPADGSITISSRSMNRTDVEVSIDQADSWSLSLTAAPGDVLRPGVFRHAEAQPDGREPALSFSGDGRGCNQTFGTFSIRQIAFDENNNPTMIDVVFAQRCESATAPLLTGHVEFVALPLSYTLDSDPGSVIDPGVHQRFTNAASVITLTPGPGGAFSFGARGRGHGIGGNVYPPPGQKRLHVGSYAVGDRFEPGRVGFTVADNSISCAQTGGRLDVAKISYVGDTVTRVLFSFSVVCNEFGPAGTRGTRPRFRGTLHYLD